MVKQKRDERMSYIRFKAAQYEQGLNLFGGNEELAKEYADTCLLAYIKNKEIFKRAYAEIKPLILQLNVPPTKRKGYNNFIEDYLSKVLIRKIEPSETIINKWERYGFDREVLEACSEKLKEVKPEVEKEIEREGVAPFMFPFFGVTVKKEELEPHAETHQKEGTDEINVVGLSGLLADLQNPLAHKTTHELAGSDEISVQGLSGLLANPQTPIWSTSVNSDIIPDVDNTHDLGSSPKRWKDLWITGSIRAAKGIAFIDGWTQSSVDIHAWGNGSSICVGALNYIYLRPAGAGASRPMFLFSQSYFLLEPLLADAENTLRDSIYINLRAKYWNGEQSVDRNAKIIHNIIDTTPTSRLDFEIAENVRMQLEDDGDLWIAGKVKNHLIPASDNTYNLGDYAGNMWKQICFKDFLEVKGDAFIQFHGIDGAYPRMGYTPTGNVELGKLRGGWGVNNFRLSCELAASNYTTKDVRMTLRGTYWNGDQSVDRDAHIKHNIIDITPTSRLEFDIAGNVRMQLEDNGDLWIAGKLTEAGCPDFKELGITPMEYIDECIEKEYHETQSEVSALIQIVKEQQERIEALEKRLSKTT